MKTPNAISKLANAIRESDQAAAECTHWDYENPGGEYFPCCRALRIADEKKRNARLDLKHKKP
jgi:hypothetical protein